MAAAPITGICSMATRHLLAELALAYEQRTGQPVTVTSVGGVEALRQVQAGASFDFVALAADAIGKLATDGHVDPGSRVDLARSGVAVAVKAGAPPPHLATGDTGREAGLSARQVGYSTGPAGGHLGRVF